MTLEAPRFVESGPLLLAGFDQRYRCDDISGIPGQWHRFGPLIGSIAGQVGQVAYGVSHEMD
ncbi:MAG TPA: hypothetical protein VFU47_02410 [Armatimonadota bacterium]|nr:hypothetical protein [Armatimonadota bacterium]